MAEYEESMDSQKRLMQIEMQIEIWQRTADHALNKVKSLVEEHKVLSANQK